MLMTTENEQKHKALLKAISSRKAVLMDYVDMKFNISEKFVDPISVQNQTLVAYDRIKKGVRQYHYDGIMKLEITKEDYVTPST